MKMRQQMKPTAPEVILAEPSHDHFRQLCAELDRIENGLLGAVLPSVLRQLERWPDALRTVNGSRYDAPRHSATGAP